MSHGMLKTHWASRQGSRTMKTTTTGEPKNPWPERRNLSLPLSRKTVCSLRAGDQLLLSGQLYTARDAAHARLIEFDAQGAELPIKLAGETIYYTGPCPAPPGA